MSLSPATASLAGYLILGQTLTWLELVGHGARHLRRASVRCWARDAGRASSAGPTTVPDAARLAEPLA